ncbi:hypothetical protein [Myxosarcina sp. GI1]|uniref:hypothetical protein n=1 Tax=Myxosarcina sp. GI1 TaxID=1541065 RepID=UPI0012E01A75|nr:hypothetical protein [Myxosarcina sp. GI1]
MAETIAIGKATAPWVIAFSGSEANRLCSHAIGDRLCRCPAGNRSYCFLFSRANFLHSF